MKKLQPNRALNLLVVKAGVLRIADLVVALWTLRLPGQLVPSTLSKFSASGLSAIGPILLLITSLLPADCSAQLVDPTNFLSFTPISDGLPGTSEAGHADSGINNVAYITWNLYTVGDQQFAAYYGENPNDNNDPLNGRIIIARRNLGSSAWDVLRTNFAANALQDDHNNVNFAIDGDGHMHLSWGMHGNFWSVASGNSRFNYAVSPNPVTGTNPLSMGPDLDTMTGREQEVTYPQLYNLPDGDLLYLFREGRSGDGDVYLNRYDTATDSWSNVHENAGGTDHVSLLKGTGFSPDWNSYPNRMVLDDNERLHMSWTNRFNGDSPAGQSGYQTNHDMFYAYSDDFGVNWNKIDGTAYGLEIVDPVAASSVAANRVADIAVSIPEGSSLINQTDMAVDQNNNPMFATWYAPNAASNDHRRQYMMSFWNGNNWETRQVSNRTIDSPGSRKNEGAVRELGRPIILNDEDGRVLLVYRDNEGSNGITVAYTDKFEQDPGRQQWTTIDLTTDNLGNYEANFDPVLWENENKLHLLYQPHDGLGNNLQTSEVSILEWNARAFFDSLESLLTLSIDRGTGQAMLINSSDAPVSIDGYSISSLAGSIDSANWSSLTDQLQPGWEEANNTDNRLSELNQNGILEIGAGQSIDLGDILSLEQLAFGQDAAADLELQFTSPDRDTLFGMVEYLGESSNNLILEVDPATGRARLVNGSEHSVSIDGYTISSDSESLDPSDGAWDSLADTGELGGTWDEANPDASRLSELTPTGSGEIAPGGIIELGLPFLVSGETDLQLRFIQDGTSITEFGIVRYLSLGIPGDFNDDGTVDGRDFLMWQRDSTIGNLSDWQANYGSQPAALTTAVPEPSALLLLASGLLVCGFRYSRLD